MHLPQPCTLTPSLSPSTLLPQTYEVPQTFQVQIENITEEIVQEQVCLCVSVSVSSSVSVCWGCRPATRARFLLPVQHPISLSRNLCHPCVCLQQILRDGATDPSPPG